MRPFLLLLLLAACTGEDEVPKTDDADGDGVAASLDCDDADATVYPGATEVWYDGVDQDCDGTDVDQDGDGYGVPADCDDEDPTVWPGAGEVPGDGVDQDCDGADLAISDDDADDDGYAADVDCNDADASVNPGADEVWYDGTDQDCDGLDDDQDGDGYVADADCDDLDPSAHPGAGEVPGDGVDQDCDGEDAGTSEDADGDGYLADVDCDDADPVVNPGASETWYDGTDQDCDGADDDQDGDGFDRARDCDDTDPTVFPGAGEVPLDGVDQDCDGADGTYPSTDDVDGDGYLATVDCNDGDATVHPGATEVWYDGTDQDCDGADDDQDGDGFARASDCDDTDATVFPGAGEVPVDGIDQDCDGADGTYPSSEDADGDGYGASVDCDDGDAATFPGAPEVWYDGVDQGCDGGDDDDQDGDGVPVAGDCDDTDPDSFPGAPEVASDGVDQDCDGADMLSGGDLTRGELVITELMKKPDAVPESYGEYIELYNASGARVLLDGVTVGAAGKGVSFAIEGGVEVAAGGYVVLAREGDVAINGGLAADFDYRSDFSLDNDAETVTVTYGAVTLDSVAYDDLDFFPDGDGMAMSLDPSHRSGTQNDNGQYWCDASSGMSDGDAGTPGADNDACPDLGDADSDGYVAAHDCDDGNSRVHPGATEGARDGVDSDCDGADFGVVAMRDGDLVITEIMQNSLAVSDADGEWFEVYNASGFALNLDGLGVGDAAGVAFTVDADVIVAAGGYVVFAVNADPDQNGGLPVVDYDWPGSLFSLGNGSDEIGLYTGATLLDRVAWDNGTSFPDPEGASMSLASGSRTTGANDSGLNWCVATSYIGGVSANDLGTPGEANDPC